MTNVATLAAALRGKALCVLTGAGCSTESGIPDYRGPETRRRARNPILGKDFHRSAEVRRRYWARSMVGFERFNEAKPNPAHHAIAAMERAGLLTGLITQNVDGLHLDAGSRRVIELHGAIREVVCLRCGALTERSALQTRLVAMNPGLRARTAAIAPDGDADLPTSLIEGFEVPDCLACDGPLKPRVVFFGENVAKPVVEEAYAMVERAEALLVVGSSLAVFSGYRFVLAASKRGIPIGIVNMGPARGDELAHVRVDGRAGEMIPALSRALGAL